MPPSCLGYGTVLQRVSPIPQSLSKRRLFGPSDDEDVLQVCGPAFVKKQRLGGYIGANIAAAKLRENSNDNSAASREKIKSILSPSDRVSDSAGEKCGVQRMGTGVRLLTQETGDEGKTL